MQVGPIQSKLKGHKIMNIVSLRNVTLQKCI